MSVNVDVEQRVRSFADQVTSTVAEVGNRVQQHVNGVVNEVTAKVRGEVPKPVPSPKDLPKPVMPTTAGDSYEKWSKAELYERAQELDVDGRSSMTKAQLVVALRAAS